MSLWTLRTRHWDAIAQKALDRKIGARGLRAVLEGVMTKVMYEIPSDTAISEVLITKDCVENGSEPEIRRSKERARLSRRTQAREALNQSNGRREILELPQDRRGGVGRRSAAVYAPFSVKSRDPGARMASGPERRTL